MKSAKVFYCYTFMLLVIYLNKVVAQRGTQCEQDSDCKSSKQWCSFGTCRCQRALIQHGDSCYNVSKYGEMCVDDAQCEGMYCYPMKEKGGQLAYCQCGRFGAFNKTDSRCYYEYKTLELLKEQNDNEGRIEREAKYIFQYVVIAGCFAMTMMAIVGLSAMLYCVYMKKQDERLKNWIKKTEAERPKTGGNARSDAKNDAMHTMDMPADMDVDMAFDM